MSAPEATQEGAPERRQGTRATGPEPCAMVIFGGSGDLSRRKLIPALYNLAVEGVLPDGFVVVGVGRREMSDESFREFARGGIEKFSRTGLDTGVWAEFEKRLFYHQGSTSDAESYRQLGLRLDELALEHGTRNNRIFYLSIPPSTFASCVEQLDAAGLITPVQCEETGEAEGPFTRVIVEKPIGRDLESAKQVNATLGSVLHESQTYRIDHYLGKETVQNLLVMRFGNAIWEPLWNQKYIDHVQITVSEAEGVGTRAGYYEEAGALRDMVQNHILQVLSLVAMEPPWSFDADVVRDQKREVLRCLRPIPKDRIDEFVVRAQYAPGRCDDVAVPGYRQEDGVARASTTETYVALKLFIDNWRWAGVPFFIRTGKRMPCRSSEIAVQFKEVPHVLFNRDVDHPLEPNILTLRIQPNEGFSLRQSAKVPGPKGRIEPVEMDFQYGEGFGDAVSPEAYERLLLDVLAGDATLYQRRDAVEAAWEWIMPILETWETSGERWLPEYDAGSWGPVEADRLIEAPGRRWREL